jgi:beta-lactamase class A
MRSKLPYLLVAIALGAASWLLAARMDFSGGYCGVPFVSDSAQPEPPPPAPQPVYAGGVDSWVTTDPGRWNDMVTSLQQLAIKFPGQIGIYVKDISTGREWQYHSDDMFPSASLIKVPIMISLFEKLKDNEVDLDDELTLKKGEKRGGSGTLRRMRYGTKLTVRQLVEKMITESDNTATRMLVDLVGLDYLQDHFTAIGLKKTGIYPEGLSLSSTPVSRENYTTPREMAMLVEGIYRGNMVDKQYSAEMLDIMKRLKTHSRFAKYLPRNWALAHKTGMLRLSCHDVGVVFSPTGNYLMAIMTGKVPDYHFAANYIAKMAAVTYRYYDINPNRQQQQGRATRARRRRR